MELSLHCLPLLSHLPRHQLRLFRYNHRRCSTFNDKWQPNQTSKLNVKSEKLSDFLNMAEVETEAEAEKKEEALEGLKRHVKFSVSLSSPRTLMESIILYYSQFISLSNA